MPFSRPYLDDDDDCDHAPFDFLLDALVSSATASISPLSGVAQDFTNPIIYTVTSEDASTQDWTVTVTEAPPSIETDITSFSFPQSGVAAINEVNHTIDIEVAFDRDVTALVSTFTLSPGASAKVGTTPQVSDMTYNGRIWICCRY